MKSKLNLIISFYYPERKRSKNVFVANLVVLVCGFVCVIIHTGISIFKYIRIRKRGCLPRRIIWQLSIFYALFTVMYGANKCQSFFSHLKFTGTSIDTRHLLLYQIFCKLQILRFLSLEMRGGIMLSLLQPI